MAESHTNRVRRRLATTTITVVTACIAGVIGSAVLHHDVTVLVDGKPHQISTTADTVAGALDDAGLTVGPHDALLPSADAAIEDGDHVSLTRGRPLELTVDGETRTEWVAATSVDDALRILGLDERGTAVSASRSQRIPVAGLDLTVRSPKDVTVTADGQTHALVSTGTTADVLTAAGITLRATDQVTPALDTYPTEGSTVTVTRVEYRTVIDRAPIPAPVEQRDTAALRTGNSRVVDAGADGVLAVTVTETVVDGRVTERHPVSEAVEVAPRPRVIENGTARQPTAAPRTADGLNWAALAQCESGGRPDAVSGSGRYRGMYQFSQQTWNGVGGVGDPAAASAQEQTYRAQLLYARSGAGQWPHCGRYL